MTSHLAEYTKIRKLRTQGYTYSEINEILKTNIPKNSLTHICRGIVLTNKQLLRINNIVKNNLKISQKRAVAANRKIFETKVKQYHDQNLNIKPLMKHRKNMLIALSMLYLGEGAKWKSFRGMMLGSSSPKIIHIYINLLNACYGITKDNLHCRIQHRADQDPVELLNYWSNITGVKQEKFYRCYIDKRTIGHPTNKLDYHGVCVVTCAGTHIQLELDQITDIINESLGGVSSVG